MKVSTPEILWHGGGLQPGKPDPVLSIDILFNNILVTSGIDASIPPKGTIRLWKLGKNDSELQFLVEFCDHPDVINSVRFSPCGKMIASASLGQIIIYTVSNSEIWKTIDDPKTAERTWLRPCLQEIYDINWSPDSQYVIAGSIDSKAEILRVKDRNSLGLRGHTSYVQGVAWDPMNQMVATQSADRSCRINMLKHREGAMVKLANKGHISIKMYGGNQQQQQQQTNNNNSNNNNMTTTLTTNLSENIQADNTPHTPTKENNEQDKLSGQISPINNNNVAISKGINLFADSTVATCFFRRLSFSPDGSLLVTPTGVFKSKSTNQTSFVTHIFSRCDLSTPIVSLAGLESPSVAVRFSPILYQMIPNNKLPLFQGDYRMIFAVVTTTAVLIYDTQSSYPLVRINGCHLANINDVAWSSNGETLVFCSSDGYVSFVRFDTNALGIPISIENVPNEVKQAFPNIYLPNLVNDQQISSLINNKIENNSDVKDDVENTTPKKQIISTETIVLKRSLEENISGLKSELVKDDSINVKKKKRITPSTEPINLQQQNQVENQSNQQSSPFKIFGIDPSKSIDLTDITPITTSNNLIIKDHIINNNTETKVKTKKRITPILGEITTSITSQIPLPSSSPPSTTTTTTT